MKNLKIFEEFDTKEDFEEIMNQKSNDIKTGKDTKTLEYTVKCALENMYMFGGMGRPNPGYDKYLNNMIKMIMTEVEMM